jgi:hypothetical protein
VHYSNQLGFNHNKSHQRPWLGINYLGSFYFRQDFLLSNREWSKCNNSTTASTWIHNTFAVLRNSTTHFIYTSMQRSKRHSNTHTAPQRALKKTFYAIIENNSDNLQGWSFIPFLALNLVNLATSFGFCYLLNAHKEPIWSDFIKGSVWFLGNEFSLTFN